MRKRSRITFAVLALVAISLLAWVLLALRDRVVNGRPESYWISTLSMNGFFSQTDVQQWQELGPDGVVILVKALGEGKGPVWNIYSAVWPKLPATFKARLTKPTDWSRVRMRAALLLGEVNTNRASATIAIPALLRTLRDTNASVRMNATAALNHFLPGMGEERDQILPGSLATIHVSNPSVRNNATIGLQYFTDRTNVVVPVLLQALQDLDSDVRRGAAYSLYRLDPTGAAEAGVIALLSDYFSAPDGRVNRGSAERVLAKIAKKPELFVPALIELLPDQDFCVRSAAADMLGQFGGQARRAVPALRQAMNDTNEMVRVAATNALKQIDPELGAKAGVE
ncbi:MAG: domain protein repeat-containing protein [Pedosphaera sp.]|nr:domain protein repeat-containing protein [Pedosphaera sp.]